ncbi:DUF4194 domain-containing protein [Rhizobium sp. MHM7A]|uniref:DUF4194 domain-containing protein n=1 Tax=Rhizobium sp. MHM7A TaxID=2583233 RepID=UPI001485F489|nr:DUF4194 domain-containing protein [Rhizobium sp. MHM7A]
MYKDLDDYIDQTFTPEQQEGMREAIAYLQKRQLFIGGQRSRVSIRNALNNNKTREFIKQHLAFSGWELVFEMGEGWFGVLPKDDAVAAKSMTALDTFIILVLANTYEQRFASADVDGQANAITSFNAFHDDLTFQSAQCGMADIKTSSLLATLEKLRQSNVIDLKAMDEQAQDRAMTIHPFIRRLAGIDAMKKLSEYVARVQNPDKVTVPLAIQDEEEIILDEVENGSEDVVNPSLNFDGESEVEDPEAALPDLEAADPAPTPAVIEKPRTTPFGRPSFLTRNNS